MKYKYVIVFGIYVAGILLGALINPIVSLLIAIFGILPICIIFADDCC